MVAAAAAPISPAWVPSIAGTTWMSLTNESVA